jgi:hypothetical protein
VEIIIIVVMTMIMMVVVTTAEQLNVIEITITTTNTIWSIIMKVINGSVHIIILCQNHHEGRIKRLLFQLLRCNTDTIKSHHIMSYDVETNHGTLYFR